MNSYEQKQEARRERLLARAAKVRSLSEAFEQRSRSILDLIPLGQPILVGHHSERRHRRDIERVRAWTSKRFKLMSYADELERRADSVGAGGISSDDEDAVSKLQAEIAPLIEQRETMKRINKQFAKGGWAAVTDCPDDLRRKGESVLLHQAYYGKPFPPYVFSNLGANIRRMQQRIEKLQAVAARPEAVPITGEGFTIREDKADNRLCVEFPGKPSAEVRTFLKGSGFKWSPQRMAWVRMLSNVHPLWGQHIAEKLSAMLANA